MPLHMGAMQACDRSCWSQAVVSWVPHCTVKQAEGVVTSKSCSGNPWGPAQHSIRVLEAPATCITPTAYCVLP